MRRILVSFFCLLILSVSSIAFAAQTIERAPSYYEKANEKIIMHSTMAIANNPNDAIAYCKRGEVYRVTGKDDLALSDLNMAIEINPRFAYAYNSRGSLYNKKGQYDLAINDFNKAIEIDPKYTSAYYNLGMAYEENLLYQDAINAYRQAYLHVTLPQEEYVVNTVRERIRALGGTL